MTTDFHPRTMASLFLDMAGSYRDFPLEGVVDLIDDWWVIDIENGGKIRWLSHEGKPMTTLERVSSGDGTHRGLRNALRESTILAEVCVRANDGGLVAWVEEARMMEVFRRVEKLQHPSIVRSILGSV
jgi:hypothetical protein